jgi:hypothetical protein
MKCHIRLNFPFPPLSVSASTSVCGSPLPLAATASTANRRPWPVGSVFPAAVAAPGLTTEVPGLAAQSLLGSSRLLKKFCSTSCCVGLGAPLSIGDFGAPARLRPPRVAPELAPSVSASTRSTVGCENDDEPKGQTNPGQTSPAAGGADASVGVRKMSVGRDLGSLRSNAYPLSRFYAVSA